MKFKHWSIRRAKSKVLKIRGLGRQIHHQVNIRVSMEKRVESNRPGSLKASMKEGLGHLCQERMKASTAREICQYPQGRIKALMKKSMVRNHQPKCKTSSSKGLLFHHQVRI